MSQIDSNVQLGGSGGRKRRIASFRERFGFAFRSDIDDGKHTVAKSTRRERRDGRVANVYQSIRWCVVFFAKSSFVEKSIESFRILVDRV